MHRLRGRPVQCATNSRMRCVQCWRISGECCAIELSFMWRWVRDRHVVRPRSHELHSVHSRSLQCSVYISVHGVRGRIRDQHPDCNGSHDMHRVCSRAVQCCVDDKLHSMSCRISDRHVGGRECDDMHCLCSRADQRDIYRGLC